MMVFVHTRKPASGSFLNRKATNIGDKALTLPA